MQLDSNQTVSRKSGASRFLNDSKFWRSHTERTQDGETKIPRLRSSWETRT
ncbi:hypothetical protein C8R28_10589 [Nitrosomonas ureae]|uniref:Uncharacterized protein n=1 Tax=Nitrosomonas ureae TaxID=44577 RepID=A0A2T5I5E1_9PROT|nr:hypothetical protein C8R28_10589 [Nitrosomonas ureae]